MAQMAGRASVEFYVGLALKGRNEREKGKGKVIEESFVIRTFRNGLGVFVSKLVFSALALHHFYRGTFTDHESHLGLELRGW
jgi:exosome complex exonuclease DIS3/RRP44